MIASGFGGWAIQRTCHGVGIGALRAPGGLASALAGFQPAPRAAGAFTILSQRNEPVGFGGNSNLILCAAFAAKKDHNDAFVAGDAVGSRIAREVHHQLVMLPCSPTMAFLTIPRS